MRLKEESIAIKNIHPVSWVKGATLKVEEFMPAAG
jgi:hypothetical protein